VVGRRCRRDDQGFAGILSHLFAPMLPAVTESKAANYLLVAKILADLRYEAGLSSAKARAALLEELEHALRRSSAQGVIFGQTVANVAEFPVPTSNAWILLNLEGRVTAGGSLKSRG